jgi:endonuclease/exonuclease/phosphatase family metal-dependent hydrolase
MKICTFNIQHCADYSIQKIGEFLNTNDIDIAILQEVDMYAKRSGNENQLEVIGKYSGLKNNYYARTMFLKDGGGQYGIGLISKRPVNEFNIENISLSSDREPRAAIGIRIYHGSNKINFFGTHLSLDETSAKFQLDYLLNKLKEKNAPYIIAGDLNMNTDTLNQLGLYEEDTVFTYPTGAAKTRLDHVFYSSDLDKKIRLKTMDDVQLSDHYPLIIKVESY